ncbi:hypothetical protein [Streptomyces sp. BE147]|uniref:hypothetical protein n=1 Tax=unclassified Streptomyces TaxID=2593676 RepID=UPI002E78502F|nr:hypothetical protein [Streptomyces sp. BE147]MEE1740994.1 hypothetical protein [Streptomyces sp. BE147]
MPWNVPENIRITMLHQMEHKQEPGLTRGTSRETSCVVRRPGQGEVKVTLPCGQCGRQGVFVIQDLATTRGLRRGAIVRSVIAAVVLLSVVLSLWVIGFGGDNIVLQVVAIPATLILGPIAVYLACDPSSDIGVESPKMITFNSDTRREGLSYVTRNPRRGEGLCCSGYAKPA